MILEPKKIKSVIISIVSPFILQLLYAITPNTFRERWNVYAWRELMSLLFHNCLDIKFIMSPEILDGVGMRQGTYPGLWKYLIGRRQGILTSEHWWNNLLQIIFKKHRRWETFLPSFQEKRKITALENWVLLEKRGKRLLISWLQSLSAVILEPKKIKSVTNSIVSPFFAMMWLEWMSWF